MAVPDFLYRAEDYLTAAPLDLDAGFPLSPPQVHVAIRAYPIRRTTPCGAWVDMGFGTLKFVNLNARKRWACPTYKEAVDSFIARKRRQVRILANQRDNAAAALEYAENGRIEDQTAPMRAGA